MHTHTQTHRRAQICRRVVRITDPLRHRSVKPVGSAVGQPTFSGQEIARPGWMATVVSCILSIHSFIYPFSHHTHAITPAGRLVNDPSNPMQPPPLSVTNGLSTVGLTHHSIVARKGLLPAYLAGFSMREDQRSVPLQVDQARDPINGITVK